MPDSKIPKIHVEPLDEPLGRHLEEKTLQIIRNMPTCTYDALAEFLEVSRSTLQRTIKLLTEQGKIERVGGKRYGHWIIKEDGLNGER